jgi:hypothetical protein
MLIQKIDDQLLCPIEEISFLPFSKNGKKMSAPITCSIVTIKKDGILYSSWRRKPSKLHKRAAKMIAKIGKYFFTGGSYGTETTTNYAKTLLV